MARRHFSDEFRKQAVRRFLTRGNQPVADLATECGVTTITLKRWVEMMSQGSSTQNQKKRSATLSVDKFALIVYFLRLPEDKQGAFLREHGLTSDQLASWEAELKSQLDRTPNEELLRVETQQAKQRVKDLEKQILRKDKVLAETTALLVLSKKLEALWGNESAEV